MSIEANQSLDFGGFVKSLDQAQELRGIRVIFYDGFKMHVIRTGPPLCGRDVRAVVIKPDIGEVTLRQVELAEQRESKFYSELTNVGFGCGGAAVSWGVAAISGSAAPISGGASLIVTKVALVAGYAGWISCGNSLIRLASEAWAPEVNDWLDTFAFYRVASNALDAIGLIGGLTAAAGTVKMALHLQRTTGKTMLQVLKGLSRQQRKELAEELIRINNPGISNKALKMFMRGNAIPKRYTPVQISHTVIRSLGDAFGALYGFAGSGYDGLINKGVHAITDEPAKPKPRQAYGNYVVGIAHSFDTY